MKYMFIYLTWWLEGHLSIYHLSISIYHPNDQLFSSIICNLVSVLKFQQSCSITSHQFIPPTNLSEKISCSGLLIGFLRWFHPFKFSTSTSMAVTYNCLLTWSVRQDTSACISIDILNGIQEPLSKEVPSSSNHHIPKEKYKTPFSHPFFTAALATPGSLGDWTVGHSKALHVVLIYTHGQLTTGWELRRRIMKALWLY